VALSALTRTGERHDEQDVASVLGSRQSGVVDMRNGRKMSVASSTLLCALLTSGIVLLSAGVAVAAPANDNFANAQLLGANDGTLTASNVGASYEPDEPFHAGQGCYSSVWYKWTAPSDGVLVVESSGIHTLLGAYTGSAVSSLTEVASDEEFWGSRIAVDVVPGTTYRIAVDGYDGETGTFQLTWHLYAHPANDDLANAEMLTGSDGTLDSALAVRELWSEIGRAHV